MTRTPRKTAAAPAPAPEAVPDKKHRVTKAEVGRYIEQVEDGLRPDDLDEWPMQATNAWNGLRALIGLEPLRAHDLRVRALTKARRDLQAYEKQDKQFSPDEQIALRAEVIRAETAVLNSEQALFATPAEPEEVTAESA